MIKTFFFPLFLLLSFASIGQNSTILKTADSLFANKKYTEALVLYDQLFENGKVSPSMLLKMAFVHDGSKQYVEALYFLDLYYKKTADRLVLAKIEELVTTNELSGYNYTDIDYFQKIFLKYREKILLVMTLLLLLTSLFHIWKIQKESRSVTLLIFQLFFALFLVVIINFKPINQGIITSNYTTLREQPAAGSTITNIVMKGHKVKVLAQGLIWVRIEWNGESAYIRTNRLKII